LTGSDGAPLRYRVWHLVERLARAGIESRVLYHSDVAALAAARRSDAVVLFRAPYSVTVAAVVAEARRRGRPVLFAVDDLVFSPELAADAPALADEGSATAQGFRETLVAYARSAQVSDAFLGSTPELVDAASELGLPGQVERNRLGAPWLARVAALDPAPRRRSEAIRVGYFSGTDTHDDDLALIAEPLARAFARFPQARLVLAGPLRIPAELARLDARLELRPFVPWSDLPASLASRVHSRRARVYVTAENLWTYSPLYKFVDNVDVENISAGSDLLLTNGGNGDGLNYPMMKSLVTGLTLTF